jgi:hypothetical protein
MLDQHFTLYQVFTLPERIAPERYVTYLTNYKYLGLHSNMRDYILLSEMQYSHCTRNSVSLCQETVMIRNTPSQSCEGSLIFQDVDSRRLCPRQLLLESRTSLLQFQRTLWPYFFPERRQGTIRCPAPGSYKPHIVTLEGKGLLQNITACFVTTPDFRTIPVLTGDARTELEPPPFYLPGGMPILTENEQQDLERIIPVNTQPLDEVMSRAHKLKYAWDVLATTSSRNHREAHWKNIMARSPIHCSHLDPFHRSGEPLLLGSSKQAPQIPQLDPAGPVRRGDGCQNPHTGRTTKLSRRRCIRSTHRRHVCILLSA